jgi:hypothetical protein
MGLSWEKGVGMCNDIYAHSILPVNGLNAQKYQQIAVNAPISIRFRSLQAIDVGKFVLTFTAKFA